MTLLKHSCTHLANYHFFLGHNGLVCAAYMQAQGLQTCVLERRHLVGGAAVTEEIVPGYKFSRASYLLSLLRPQIAKDLELKVRWSLLKLGRTSYDMSKMSKKALNFLSVVIVSNRSTHNSASHRYTIETMSSITSLNIYDHQ